MNGRTAWLHGATDGTATTVYTIETGRGFEEAASLLGSDYDGIDVTPMQLDDVSGFPYLTQALLERGYSTGDIHKIMGGNVLRALRAAERVAREWKGEIP